MLKRPISTTPIYGNWVVKDPNGLALFRCSDKRAQWYLKRNLATEVTPTELEPLVIQLTFTPKGRGAADDPSGYHLEAKEHRCVVCGTEDNLTKHHVVPTCFRKHFPKELKSRASFDIVVVCHECHDSYEQIALAYHKQLRSTTKHPTNKTLQLDGLARMEGQKVRGFLSALILHNDKIPNERKAYMEDYIDNYFKRSVYPEEYQAVHDEVDAIARESESYGKEVVEQQQDLFGFIVSWRKHFLDHAKPQFLSDKWINFYDKVIR